MTPKLRDARAEVFVNTIELQIMRRSSAKMKTSATRRRNVTQSMQAVIQSVREVLKRAQATVSTKTLSVTSKLLDQVVVYDEARNAHEPHSERKHRLLTTQSKAEVQNSSSTSPKVFSGKCVSVKQELCKTLSTRASEHQARRVSAEDSEAKLKRLSVEETEYDFLRVRDSNAGMTAADAECPLRSKRCYNATRRQSRRGLRLYDKIPSVRSGPEYDKKLKLTAMVAADDPASCRWRLLLPTARWATTSAAAEVRSQVAASADR